MDNVKLYKVRSYFIIFLLISFCLFNIAVNVPPIPNIMAIQTPADGDTWTENNNATYVWKFHTSYKDTMAWTTTDTHEGSYALNVTHTKPVANMYFRLVFDQTYDVSSYDGVFCWLKITSPDVSFTFKMAMNPTDTNWDAVNQLVTPLGAYMETKNATWIKIFCPLFLFDASGNANLTSVRQIYFIVTAVGSADNTEVLVDNLYFTTFDVEGQTPTTDQMKIMPLAFYNLKLGQYDETISGTTYTTSYDWQNLTDNTVTGTTLETEVLGQQIFALAFAYNRSRFDFYLTEAERLVNILLLGQQTNGLGAGGFSNYFSAGSWNNILSSVYNGWILAGLSQLYGVTSNTTYKTACDSLRNYLTGVMWNNTHACFNSQFDNTTQVVTYGTGYSTMRDGSCSMGIATYHRFVSANTTVLNCLNAVLNNILNLVNPYGQRMTFENKYEDHSYQMWGMWQAFQITSNTTYKNSFLNTSKILINTYMKNPSLNGSATRHVGEQYVWGIAGNYMDGWGLHNSLPLLVLANEIEPQSYFINALELSLFNHLSLTQDDAGGFQRANTVLYADRQYYGTPAFILLASELYNQHKETALYVPASTGLISEITETTDEMTITLTGTGTTTTYVYCGNKGKPAVIGASSIDWIEQTRMLIFTVAQSSTNKVALKWGFAGSSNHTLTVLAMLNGLPTNANISFDNGKNHTIFGLGVFSLAYDTYDVTAYVGDQSEIKTVGVFGPVTVGFSFNTPTPYGSGAWWMVALGTTIVLCVAGTILILGRKR